MIYCKLARISIIRDELNMISIESIIPAFKPAINKLIQHAKELLPVDNEMGYLEMGLNKKNIMLSRTKLFIFQLKSMILIIPSISGNEKPTCINNTLNLRQHVEELQSLCQMFMQFLNK